MTPKTDDRAFLERLLALPDLTRFPDAKAFEVVAHVIDISSNFKRGDGIDRALGWCDDLEKRALGPSDVALLNYYRANAWHSRQQARHTDSSVAWEWRRMEAMTTATRRFARA
jgi:hypothetical protein